MKNYMILMACICFGLSASFAQKRPPIIDMHMHALKADAQGPPPLAMCTPFEIPTRDPAGEKYIDSFYKLMKNPPCDDPVWSPETDEALMLETFEVMEKYNIHGVVSGDELELVQRSKAHNPSRIIPSMFLRISPDIPSPDSIKTLLIGLLKPPVFTNLYQPHHESNCHIPLFFATCCSFGLPKS